MSQPEHLCILEQHMDLRVVALNLPFCDYKRETFSENL